MKNWKLFIPVFLTFAGGACLGHGVAMMRYHVPIDPVTYEWQGTYKSLPEVFVHYKGRRLVKRTMGAWQYYFDLDSDQFFGEDGTEFEFYHPRNFGAVEGGINLFTDETHHNPTVKITIGTFDEKGEFHGDPKTVVRIPARVE